MSDRERYLRRVERLAVPLMAGACLILLIAAALLAAPLGIAGGLAMAGAMAGLAGLVVLHERARRRAETRRAALERDNAVLMQENEDLRVFVSATTHDLHEPLRKIQVFGDRLRDRMGLMPDPDALRCLERMTDAATRLRDLLDALKIHVRIDSRNTAYEPLDLDELVADILSARTGPVPGAIEVSGLAPIEADRAQLRILFENLIDNALKYRRPDANVHIRISGRTETGSGGGRIVIEITDNGIGFENRHSERIFGLLERLHARDAYPGAGVGLATCRKIARQHGGSISARGESGQGACFTLILPLQQANLSYMPLAAGG
jgi:signal transduction histidine kinase